MPSRRNLNVELSSRQTRWVAAAQVAARVAHAAAAAALISSAPSSLHNWHWRWTADSPEYTGLAETQRANAAGSQTRAAALGQRNWRLGGTHDRDLSPQAAMASSASAPGPLGGLLHLLPRHRRKQLGLALALGAAAYCAHAYKQQQQRLRRQRAADKR